MVVNTLEEIIHCNELEDFVNSVRKHNMQMNLSKFSFMVYVRNIMGFMLITRGREANPDKCRVIINMRSLTTTNEVQQLTGVLDAIFRFLSCSKGKAFNFFPP